MSRKSVCLVETNQAYQVSKKIWKQGIQYQADHRLNRWLLQRLVETPVQESTVVVFSGGICDVCVLLAETYKRKG